MYYFVCSFADLRIVFGPQHRAIYVHHILSSESSHSRHRLSHGINTAFQQELGQVKV